MVAVSGSARGLAELIEQARGVLIRSGVVDSFRRETALSLYAAALTQGRLADEDPTAVSLSKDYLFEAGEKRIDFGPCGRSFGMLDFQTRMRMMELGLQSLFNSGLVAQDEHERYLALSPEVKYT